MSSRIKVERTLYLHPWHLTAAYFLDLVLGDPPGWPHPVRWIGQLIAAAERFFYRQGGSALAQRSAGCAFWMTIVMATTLGTYAVVSLAAYANSFLGHAVVLYLAYSLLATRSLHRESKLVVEALSRGKLELARKRLTNIVSRDTANLDEQSILRAVIETVSENISDGIVAPLFYLAAGGVVGGVAYKTINTMDSMVGYQDDRYRYFGWFSAKSDDIANWIPARLSGWIMVFGAACLGMGWKRALHVMKRDASKSKSPNAGFPESAAAGALNVQLGGANTYFGEVVEKATLGDPLEPITFKTYSGMIRLMYVSSALAFILFLVLRKLILTVAS